MSADTDTPRPPAPVDPGAAQNRASDPGRSVWVAANAGSGKTRVLTDRVIRLLIRGADPGRILCLTYTRAAAAEMQNRLFDRLGNWAMLPDTDLRAALAGLDESGADLPAARRLFAQALEVPGGLKIQTIHAFCAAVLRRFPLEAGVAPGFREMEAREATRLRADIVEVMAEAEPDLCDALFAVDPRGDPTALTGEILRQRADFAAPPDGDAIWRGLGLVPGDDLPTLYAHTLQAGDGALLSRLIGALRGGSANDVKAADKLAPAGFGGRPDAAALTDADRDRLLATLEDVLLYGETAKAGPFAAKIGAFPTKATRAALGPDLEPLHDLMTRVEAARPRRLAIAAAQASLALHRFAVAFIARYDARKAALGALDFDDLIGRTSALLNDSAAAQWVLWKLDGGLDHILVDEAQDTSPAQWAVIRRLAEEFMAGSGADRAAPRTLFVVGDEKQSIYSFQGADPAGFGATRAHFADRLAPPGPGLRQGRLPFSFRSAPAILGAVDAVFGAGRPGVPLAGPHQAIHSGRSGRVDWWPLVAAMPEEDAPDWDRPAALRPGAAAQAVLAGQVAEAIAGWLAGGVHIETGKPGDPRPIGPGDIMILVQRRSDMFHGLIAALKARGLPVAGADRLKIGGELAVRDLTAVLSFLATPEDDLSLAAALRSPLFGLSEDALFRLAHGRKGTLWEALRNRSDRHAEVLERLRDLRNQAGFLRPHELIERMLTRQGGRARLIARLGAEAEDGIDALLAQALAWERTEIGELTGFLGWLAAGELEIKRQMEAAGDRIRVMTAHGAKGLQAPVVILPDTVRQPPRLRDRVLALPGGGTGFLPGGAERSDVLEAAAEERRARDAEERARLLYVAMTRAEAWLIVAGAGDPRLAAGDWHGAVGEGLQAAQAVPVETPSGAGLRLAQGAWPASRPVSAATDLAAPDLPGWATAHAPAAPHPAAAIRPSDLGGAKALPGEAGDDAAARARGSALHLVLEYLPGAPDPEGLAARLLPGWAAPDRAALLAEARAVLADPALQHLFAHGTLAEVGVVLPGAPPLQGQIDRLVVAPDRVLAVDFKSNRTLPGSPDAVPPGLLRQMAAYRHALRRIYPDRAVGTAILWTRAPLLMPLTDGLLDRAAADLALP